MSQENVEIVRQSFEAYAGGDVEEMLSYIDPDGEMHSAIIGGAEGQVYRGHGGFRRWYSDSMESFDELITELEEYRDLGDRVVAFGHMRARGRGSGVEIDSPVGWIFSVRWGKVVRIEGFLSRAEALKAAGLSE